MKIYSLYRNSVKLFYSSSMAELHARIVNIVSEETCDDPIEFQIKVSNEKKWHAGSRYLSYDGIAIIEFTKDIGVKDADLLTFILNTEKAKPA